MSIKDQVKSLAEDIETSYETRKAAVADLARETHQTLDNFKRERKKMSSDLKRSLAADRATRTSQTQKMRASNGKDLKDMARELKRMTQEVSEFLSTSEKERNKEFTALMGKIKGVVAAIEEDTATTLADFRSDHRDMAQTLKMDLASETSERIKTIHELMSRFAKEHEEMAGSLRSGLTAFKMNLSQVVDDMLADFSADHRQTRTHLKHMTREMATKRAGKSVPAPAAKTGVPTPPKPAAEDSGESKKKTGKK